RIRLVDATGVITTVAGNGTYGFSGDGGAATSASLFYPAGVAVDGSGNLFVADPANHRVRQVDAAGGITTVAGDGRPGLSGGDGGFEWGRGRRHQRLLVVCRRCGGGWVRHPVPHAMLFRSPDSPGGCDRRYHHGGGQRDAGVQWGRGRRD